MATYSFIAEEHAIDDKRLDRQRDVSGPGSIAA